MKTRNSFLRLVVWLFAATGIAACTQQQDDPEIPGIPREKIPFSLHLNQTGVNTSTLQYGLYLFSRNTDASSGEDYRLDSIMLPVTESSRLKFSNEELSRKAYRFLFMATPGDNTALQVMNSGLSALTPGTSWKDIRIVAPSGRISIDNYYQVIDRSGQEILALDTLKGHLTRLVGQLIFRFIKIGEDINDQQPIDLRVASSVFDRISSIRVDYENYTRSLAFDEQGNPYPEPAEASDQTTISQTLTPTLQNFRVDLPQTDLDPVDGEAALGGEIKGYCFLPQSKQLRTTLTFTYYDTTPKCGDASHSHDESCFSPGTLTVYIPKKSAPGLSVEANAYTVNKAGIRCDRIIDIGYETNMDIITDWF